MAADRAPVLRPLGVGDLLDELFAVYRRGFKPLIGIAAVVQLPLAIVSLAFVPIAVGFPQMYDAAPGVMPDFGPLLPWIAGLLVVVVPVLIVGSILEMGAICHATSALYLGQVPRVAAAYRFALARFWRLFRLGLLGTGIVLGFMALAIAPVAVLPLLCVAIPALMAGTYLSVSWSLALPALVLEDLPGAIPSIGRSRDLVRGAWWRTLGTLLLLSVLLFVLQGVAAGLLGVIGGGLQMLAAVGAFDRPVWAAVLNSLLSSAVNVVFAPLFYIGITLVYYDRRVRAEAYDLSVLARDLARPGPDPTPS